LRGRGIKGDRVILKHIGGEVDKKSIVDSCRALNLKLQVSNRLSLSGVFL
jgi:hypothetical protein